MEFMHFKWKNKQFGQIELWRLDVFHYLVTFYRPLINQENNLQINC